MEVANALQDGLMPWIYYTGRTVVWLFFFLLTRREVKGRSNVPIKGPVLIVANHISLADPPLLGISFGRKVIFMAKEELFRSRFIAYFMRRFGTFPVNRRRLGRAALRQARQVLDDGLPLVVFPEGKRSRSGQLERALPGAALIACRSGVPIIPVGISGTEQARGITWILRRPRITVNIGRPFYLTPPDGKLTREELAELANSIMKQIAELLPREYRGNYQT